MQRFDEQITETLRAKSEWPGSADALWGRISSDLDQPRSKWRRKRLWVGMATAATIFLAFMIHTMLTPLPPDPPDPQFSRLASPEAFSLFMVPEEIQTVLPGEEVQIALGSYFTPEGDDDRDLRLVIWRSLHSEEVLVEERLLEEDEILGQSVLWVVSPTEPGLYRFVVEGTLLTEGERMTLAAEQTIRVEGKEEDAISENDQP
ncbi:MAG: hypothetical protein QM451_12450 [Bacillota bacterium]|jgi:hypothetical protein|nr:hypothetical protein [Bacillota bacterium]